METKICPCCKQEKPISEFGKNKNTKDGLNCYCKICTNQKSINYYFTHLEQAKETRKKYRENNREERKRINREWYAINKEQIHKRVTQYREDNHLRKLITHRIALARKKNIIVDSIDALCVYLQEKYNNAKCEHCGRELQHYIGQKYAGEDGFSIDRINPNYGYVVGNVAILCRECNRTKDNLTWQEHLMISNWQKEREELFLSQNNQKSPQHESVVNI
jgi:hypothetical protein